MDFWERKYKPRAMECRGMVQMRKEGKSGKVENTGGNIFISRAE